MIVAMALLASTSVVTIDGGTVSGLSGPSDRRFLGIAYAAAPIGALQGRPPERFVPPRSRQAKTFGPSCTQNLSPDGFGPWTKEFVVSGRTSDDCLFLNVWAPKRSKGAPVLFWIHGGGFVSGSGSVPIYDGSAFARQGIIVVTVNYRLGDAGFPVTKGTVPNLGLLDLVAALRWVRRNAKAFGGDPQRVTIAGQSAGAMLVHALLAMPAAKGLFAQAIMESGLPPDAGAAGSQLRLTSDLPMSPPVAWRDGAVSDVPILIGMTADETSAFTVDVSPNAAPPSCGPSGLALLASGLTPRAAASWCGRQALLDWWQGRATTHLSPAYAYLFARPPRGSAFRRWGAFHSMEIPYVFGSLRTPSIRQYNQADYRLSHQMNLAWARYIKGRRPWPELTGRNPRMRVLAEKLAFVPLAPFAAPTMHDSPDRYSTTLF